MIAQTYKFFNSYLERWSQLGRMPLVGGRLLIRIITWIRLCYIQLGNLMSKRICWTDWVKYPLMMWIGIFKYNGHFWCRWCLMETGVARNAFHWWSVIAPTGTLVTACSKQIERRRLKVPLLLWWLLILFICHEFKYLNSTSIYVSFNYICCVWWDAGRSTSPLIRFRGMKIAEHAILPVDSALSIFKYASPNGFWLGQAVVAEW